MVKIWDEESTDWRLELEPGENTAPLTLRPGENGRTLVTALGKEPTAETVRRAAAKTVKTIRELGAASALLDALRRHGRARPLTAFMLEVRPSNKNALMLYEKFGYTEVGRRKNYYLSPKEDAIIMRLELTHAAGNIVP